MQINAPAEQTKKTIRSRKAKRPADGRNGSPPQVEDAFIQTQEILAALIAFRNGDFSARLPVVWTGLNGKIADAFNDIISMNGRVAAEMARVSHVVGTEGKLSQRVRVPGASGAWSDKVTSINTLIDDLVRPTTEVARTI